MKSGFLVIAAAGVLLTACGQQTPEKDRPNPGPPAAPVPATENSALIDATPQVSLSEEQRAQLRDLAKGYIDDAAKENTKGFTAVAGIEDAVVALQPSQSHAWTLSLKGGESYRIIGGCDNECEDMDLELLDPAGKIIERDTLPDSFPIINVTPRSPGTYTARLVMKTCTVAPCYAAARLYHKTGSTAEPAKNSTAA